ncbi:MAG: DUF3343 domain-containing protein [Treponema sp.]|jgi:hypothetical protein|nr:DUF3343 domain-containing protein [Treponema sp.]
MKLLVTFEIIADSFSCDKTLKAAGHSCRIIPEPRNVGVSCNYAVEIQNIETEEEVSGILRLLKHNNIDYVHLFRSIHTPQGETY